MPLHTDIPARISQFLQESPFLTLSPAISRSVIYPVNLPVSWWCFGPGKPTQRQICNSSLCSLKALRSAFKYPDSHQHFPVGFVETGSKWWLWGLLLGGHPAITGPPSFFFLIIKCPGSQKQYRRIYICQQNHTQTTELHPWDFNICTLGCVFIIF